MLLGVVGYQIAKARIRRDFPPAAIQSMEKFLYEPVEIPQEWLVVEPYPEDLLALAERVPDESKAYWGEMDDVFELPSPCPPEEEITEEQWLELKAGLEENAGFIDLMTELARHPAYEMGVFDKEKTMSWISPLRTASHAFVVKGSWLAHNGLEREAFQASLDCMRLGQHGDVAPLVNAMIGIAIQNCAVETLSDLASNCNDPSLLRETLEEMSAIHKRIDENYPWEQIGLAENVALFLSFGQNIDLSSGHPGTYYWEQFLRLHRSRKIHRRLLSIQPFRKLAVEYYCLIATPNFSKALEDRLKLKAKFDLSRLFIASRTIELETGKPFGGNADDFADIFAEPLADPYSNQPYVWDASEAEFFCERTTNDGKREKITLRGPS